ncbi:MAG TPA: DUF4445 domain-containing protein [Chloroflexi bacterium]|nr:DUF4445 domain-containing protein [Chloroflexota bacterium]
MKRSEAEFRVDWEPIGKRVRIPDGETLLAAAQAAGVELVALCGGAGLCGSCRVRRMEGELSPLTPAEEAALTPEEIEAGYRLACQARPLSDVKIDVPPESLTTPQRLQVEGQEAEVPLDPMVEPVDLEIVPPDLHDLRADDLRVEAALAEEGVSPVSISPPVLASISDDLRTHRWSVRLAHRQGEVVAVLPTGTPLLGLAVDIGTTKLAAYLVDLGTGRTLAKTGAMNPQIAYGEDVIARIGYANDHPDGRQVLQSRLVATLNQMVADLCAEAGAEPEQIVEAVVVGNTVMHHLFAGLPVRQLGTAPYVPAVARPLNLRARDLGLRLAPGAYVYLPPNVAGYVGADHVSMLLACDVHKTRKTTIALDIGTNTEVTLAYNGRLISSSCASGPAFEGAHLKDGMRAAPGAIERVWIVGEKVHIQTIGNAPPVGICGSGILDAVAQMVEAGVLDRRGQIRPGHPRVRAGDRNRAFVLAPASISGHGRDVVVTRKDVNEIQLAKGAIRAGIEVLLAEAGIPAEAVEEVIVAGAFGTYLDIESAVRVGMFPPLPLDRFRQVGNAAGAGARQMLVSAARRREAEEIARRVEYVELTVHPAFRRCFVDALSF